MKYSIVFCINLLFTFVCLSQTESVTATYKYTLGDNDTRNDAKRIALLEAKRICVEKVGTYVQGQMTHNVSESIQNGKSQFSDITKSDVSTFIGALVKVDIVGEKFSFEGNTQNLVTTVKAIISTKDITEKLRQIKYDDDLRNKVIKQQEELKQLQGQFLELQKRINKTSPEKAYTLREQRKEIFEEIDELEVYRFQIKSITKKVVTNIDIGMTENDVIKFADQPRIKTYTYFAGPAWNYGDIWVVFDDGVVIAIVKNKDFRNDDLKGNYKYESLK